MPADASNASPEETAQISYELVEPAQPRVVVVDLLNETLGDPGHAAQLGQQLSALIRQDLPRRYVLDFQKVRVIGSTAFGALIAFILKVRQAGGRVGICNMHNFVRFGADVIRMGDYAEFAPDRQTAIEAFLKE
jgi:anti-anti-sigma factor